MLSLWFLCQIDRHDLENYRIIYLEIFERNAVKCKAGMSMKIGADNRPYCTPPFHIPNKITDKKM